MGIKCTLISMKRLCYAEGRRDSSISPLGGLGNLASLPELGCLRVQKKSISL